MSSTVTVKRAVAVAALVCASAAGYFWYKKRRNRRKTSSPKSKSPVSNRQGSPKSVRRNSLTKSGEKPGRHLSGDDTGPEEERQDIDYNSDLSSCDENEDAFKNRGRKNYRPHLKSKNKTAVQAEREEKAKIVESVHQQPSKKEEVIVNGTDSVTSKKPDDRMRWTDEAERSASTESSEPEIASAALSNGLVKTSSAARVHAANNRVYDALSNVQNGASLQNGGAAHIIRNPHAPSPAVSSVKSQSADSPSLGSDLHSEASADSGKGASTGLTSSMSPVEEIIEVPPVYEFEVPRDIVGLLIGKKGMTIKWLTEQSQAYIVIRDHFYSDKHKICTLEGTREQINKCLRLIRRKFPPSRFPELRLTPILPPPVSTTPRTPVWDNVVQLNLPEGVNCEVAVSSIVNIGHVFVQQPTHPTFSSLARLDQYMLAVYGQPASVPPLPRPIEMGVICAAPVLGGWYRAQTIDIYDDTDEALVKFVDYGGYCRVPASDLRQIRSDFMTLPFQATECYLANISPVDETEGWSPEALSLFESLSLGKVIEARVTGHSSDSTPLVELYSSTPDSKSVLINRVLVDRGYAAWTETGRV